eukprot:4760973-Pyramimonas_sp.AAC.1
MSIIVYSDEITPGNPLQSSNLRKVQCMYWSWQELGFPTLQNELSWFTACALRASEVQRLPGGMAELYKYVLRFFLGHPRSRDLRHGVAFFVP